MTDDKIYIITPSLEGFKATWGFDPTSKGKLGPKHEWITDELRPYTEADRQADALAVALIDQATNQ